VVIIVSSISVVWLLYLFYLTLIKIYWYDFIEFTAINFNVTPKELSNSICTQFYFSIGPYIIGFLVLGSYQKNAGIDKCDKHNKTQVTIVCRKIEIL
jgi:hypothetical protein